MKNLCPKFEDFVFLNRQAHSAKAGIHFIKTFQGGEKI